MKHIVSFSGGRTSAYLVHLMEQKRINEGWDVEYIFMDTGAEHPKTYEFIRNIANNWNVKITCLKALVSQEMGVGNNYQVVDIKSVGWDLATMRQCVRKYGGFTNNRPYCTDKLKTIINTKYKRDNFGRGSYTTWLGIRADEPRRIKHTSENVGLSKNPENIRYLAEISDFDKSDILQFWESQDFDLEIDEHLGNCVFCIKKTDAKVALAQRDEPELFEQWNSLVNAEDVRPMPADKFGKGRIYRKWLSPQMLISQFSGFTTEELRERVYKTSKKTDSETCSESCEIYSSLPDEKLEQAA